MFPRITHRLKQTARVLLSSAWKRSLVTLEGTAGVCFGATRTYPSTTPPLTFQGRRLSTMAPVRPNLVSFLKESRQSAGNLAISKRPVQVVLGNEAADLDSIVCAVTLSFLQRHQSDPNVVCLPFVNIPRKELPLRLEVTFLFKKLGISTDDLLLQEDLDLLSLHQTNPLTLTLCDHNKLTTHLEPLGGLVRDVIDHHKDEQLYPQAKKHIEMVGSCATLVAEKILNEMPTLLEDPLVTQLLVYTILLDSIGLDWSKGRVTQRDVDVLDRLQPYVSGLDRTEAFKEINRAKFFMSAMTADQLLRKDYKGVGGPVVVGISSIGVSLSLFFHKEQVTADIESFMREKGLSAVVVMSVFTDASGEFRRELAVCSHDSRLVDQLANGLREDATLRLTANQSGPENMNGLHTVCFSQGNLAASRKVVLPLVTSLLSK